MDDKNTQMILNAIQSTIQNAIKDLEQSLTAKFDAKLDALEKRLTAKFDAKLDAMDEHVKHLSNLVTKMEIEHGDKIQLLLERTSSLIEQYDDSINMTDRLSSKYDNHEIRLQILEEKVL